VFVTGVPGAGKTLVGLNVATRRRTMGTARAVYLSGNGPLVAVLQEAHVVIFDEAQRAWTQAKTADFM
jgi:KaiC/GvpD/RAD55 family RecA-like ATPase